MTQNGALTIDPADPVRKGEELDETALRAHLAQNLSQFDHDIPLQIRQFLGGHSNLTYLIEQGDSEFILRRPPLGSTVKHAHDMSREYRVLSKLGPVYDKAPSPLYFCDDDSIIGANFYLVQRVRGLILRKDFPDEITHSVTLHREMCCSLVESLAELHALNYEKIGLAELGRPEGYCDRQVRGWSTRYQKAKTDSIPDVEWVGSWLEKNLPPNSDTSLLHNDFKFDNLVLNPCDLREIVGVLDWEMATLGDPLMDLGTALSYWISADDPEALQNFRFVPTHLPGMMSRQEVADAYGRVTGRDMQHILFYYVFGLFKLIGIVQQIYYRFHQGLTTDPRFGQFIHAVRILSAHAKSAIEREAIS